jgi:hypothetical protein
LAQYQELSHGSWPDPQVYESLVRSKQISRHAPYEAACLLAGEVSARVKACGLDGLLVEDLYGMNGTAPKRPGQIARERRMRFKDVCNRLNKVLWYCTDDEETGGRRREIYEDWKKRKEYRKSQIGKI